MNAAIVRNPTNVKMMKNELKYLCAFILQQARAENVNADLVGKSDKIKQEVDKLRQQNKESLDDVKNVEHDSNQNTEKIKEQESTFSLKIKQLQKEISIHYTNIMADIAQYCVGVLGEAPCKFSIAGMGSLAREEVTPYSDFEHIILLENQENYDNYVEYFRWYSVIFHVIVLNLQETIVPSLDITGLKNKEFKTWFYDAYTPCGISFDGMMPHACKFPLGRQTTTKDKPFVTELIKPVNEMLDYLTSDAHKKNGYHLADILTKNCYVYGDPQIYNGFSAGVNNYLNAKPIDELKQDILSQVKDDLNNFATRHKLSNLTSSNTFNVKQNVYRSLTLFLSALGRLNKLNSNSCFDVIEKLDSMEVKPIT